MKMKMKNHSILTLVMVSTLLGASCAKKLDDKFPDNYERDYFSVELFKAPVEIVTEDVSFYTLKAEEEANFVFAQQEKPKFKVKVIDGPKEITHLFKDLNIEAPRGGYKAKVYFSLTDSTLTAFMEIERPEDFSESTQQLITVIDGKKVIPIFEYSGLTYGIMEKDKNDYNEETRNVVFKPEDKSISSHVTFTALADSRRKVGFDVLPAKDVLRTKMVTNRLWPIEKVKEFFLLPEGFEQEFLAKSKNQNKLLTKIVDEKLYLYAEKKASELTHLEKELYQNKDERFSDCQSIFKTEKPDCVFQAILSHDITYVKAKLREENQKVYGQIDLERGVSKQTSGLITYSLNSTLTEIKYDKELSLENNELFRIESFNEKQFTGVELKNILGIVSKEIVIDDKNTYLIKIFDNTLLVLEKTDSDKLSLFETGAVKNHDPRFSICHESEKNNTKTNCVYRPILKKNIEFGKFKYEKVVGSNQPSIEFKNLATTDEATHIRIRKEVASVPFKYLPSEKFPDQIVTHKELHYDLESEYVYVPMTHGTPRKIEGAAPFYQGTEKIVKIRFQKDGLEVYEPEAKVLTAEGKLATTKMSTNDLNSAPVLKIPGSYIDFTCAKDERDQCVGATTIDSDKTWQEQSYFLPSLENLQVQELNSLDLFTVEDNPCVYKIAQKLTHYEIKKGVINIELEKTFKTSNDFRCIIDHYIADPEGLTELSNAAFKVRYHYSLMRLEDLESKNYEPVKYAITDHGKFGFFKNSVKLENDTHDVMRQEKTYFLNRWNPKKGVITYHLNDSFYKPENTSYLQMTEKGIKHINDVLKKAETGIQLELQNGSNIKVGDLKNSSIVLIDDPLSNGLLGYAPTVSNPRTGEILQGHVNMYPGNIRSMARSVYESMVDLSYEESLIDDSIKSEKPLVLDPKVTNSVKKALLATKSKTLPALEAYRPINGSMLQQKITAYNKTKYNKELVFEKPKSDNFDDMIKYDQDKTDYFSEHCAYSMEFLPGGKSINKIFKEVRENKKLWFTHSNGKQRLKRWKDLSLTERKWAADVISPKIYLSTFIHEMGHNLGLRHNFIGSFDKDNYYSPEEAKELGLERSPEYSSVMDYSGEELNSLTVFGKYDVAALRFGYARKIEVQSENGVKIVPVTESIKKTVEKNQAPAKNYLFCTDENAGLSPLCNRFDEGSSFKEIAEWRINNYITNYRYRNLRDDREEFKKYSMNYYAAARFNEFSQIQNMFHFVADFRPKDYINFQCNDEQRKQFEAACKGIDEEKELFKKVGDFFLTILKTPDHVCTVSFTLNNRTQKGYIPFASLMENYPKNDGDNITSCFDPALQEAIVDEVGNRYRATQNIRLVSEGGSPLNSIREQNERFKYSDDIGIRGSWVDRALAARFLFRRTTDMPFKMQTISLMDYSPVMMETFNVLEHLILKTPLKNPVPFKTQKGDLVTELYQIDSKAIIDTEDLNSSIRKALMLPDDGDEYLLPIIVKNAHRGNQANDITNKDYIQSISRLFEVKKGILERLGNNDDKSLNLEIDGTTYIAGEANFFAQAMMGSIRSEEELKGLNVEKINQNLTIRQGEIKNIPETLPIELSEVEKVLLQQGEMEIATIIDLKQKGFDSKEKLAKVYGPQVANAFAAKVMISDEKLQQIEILARSLNAEQMDQNDEEIKTLLKYDLKKLIEFANQSLTNKNEHYRYVLQNLPVEKR